MSMGSAVSLFLKIDGSGRLSHTIPTPAALFPYLQGLIVKEMQKVHCREKPAPGREREGDTRPGGVPSLSCVCVVRTGPGKEEAGAARPTGGRRTELLLSGSIPQKTKIRDTKSKQPNNREQEAIRRLRDCTRCTKVTGDRVGGFSGRPRTLSPGSLFGNSCFLSAGCCVCPPVTFKRRPRCRERLVEVHPDDGGKDRSPEATLSIQRREEGRRGPPGTELSSRSDPHSEVLQGAPGRSP